MKGLRRWRHSIRLRLVGVFLLLALALTLTFIGGAQKAFSLGWREAARPLLMDYVSRLAEDVAPSGTPEPARAMAIVQRLPMLRIEIQGPSVNWRSDPVHRPPPWSQRFDPRDRGHWDEEGEDSPLLTRLSADGHTIGFGLNERALKRPPRLVGVVLLVLLVLTGLAFWAVRRLLSPLDAIQAGAMRFGQGDFAHPIDLPARRRHDELGELAGTINTMGRDIEHMLQAQRALLLAISHELRSPLTRARLHTELLPDTAELQPQREALLRDLGEMARLISDLLESERLAGRHAALHREPTDLATLVRETLDEWQATRPEAAQVVLHLAPNLPAIAVDRVRVQLLLRNLLDNAWRHSAGAAQPPELQLQTEGSDRLSLSVRDHGPGVPEEQLAQLGQAFYRPDSARTRHAGGVGLGLYLCRLVAQAHGGSLVLENAHPGLRVRVVLPLAVSG